MSQALFDQPSTGSAVAAMDCGVPAALRLRRVGLLGGLLLMLAATVLEANQSKAEQTAMMTELKQQAQTEIIELHRFFQSWYRRQLEPSAFARFEQALADGFQIITPAGHVLQRERILDAVRQQSGSDATAVLEIRNVEAVAVADQLAVFRYEEWQSSASEPPRGRLSTVVFKRDADASNGLLWLQVHETWLPE